MSIETEVKAVEAAVVSEVKAVEGEVVKEVKAAVIQLKAEEKLFLADTELEFLKAQTEIKRLTEMAESKSKAYQAYVENLFKTYAVTKAEYVFDGIARVLKTL